MPEEPIVFTKSPNTLIGPNDDVLIPEAPPRPTGRLSSRSSSAGGAATSKARPRLPRSLLGTRWRTTSASARSRWSAVDSGARASPLPRSIRWGRGWSRPTRSRMSTHSACGWTSTRGDGRRVDRDDDLRSLTIVHYLTQFFVLEPGDVINTGTPPGVGMGHVPQVFLAPGDVMELGIDGLGTQRQRVRAPRPVRQEVPAARLDSGRGAG